MDLVIDANILISAAIKDSLTRELLYNDNIHLFAPEFIFIELEKYKNYILEKTGKTENDFYRLIGIFEKRITLFSKEEIEPYLEKASQISPDIKDITYFATAIKLNCDIWSNDGDLKEKQNHVKVWSTKELLTQLWK